MSAPARLTVSCTNGRPCLRCCGRRSTATWLVSSRSRRSLHRRSLSNSSCSADCLIGRGVPTRPASEPVLVARRHSVTCEEYDPSRRSNPPFAPASVQPSYCATIASLYSAVKQRRRGRTAESSAVRRPSSGRHSSAVVKVIRLGDRPSPCRDEGLQQVSHESLTDRARACAWPGGGQHRCSGLCGEASCVSRRGGTFGSAPASTSVARCLLRHLAPYRRPPTSEKGLS